VLLELVVGDRETAGGADLVDVDEDDAAGAGDGVDVVLLDKVGELGGAVLKGAAVAKEAQDAGAALKGVEHDGDAAIAGLVEVRDGLVAAARQVEIPEGALVE